MSATAPERSAPLEVRLAGGGRTLTGEAVRYGRLNPRAAPGIGPRSERFERGSIEPVEPVLLTLQHDRERRLAGTDDGTLRLHDTHTSFNIEADLRVGSAELDLVRRGALRGLSVEFWPKVEHRAADGVRVLERVSMPALSLVDIGSHESTVELRAMEGAWLRAVIPEGHRCSCECAGRDCDSVIFGPGSLDDLVDGPDDVIATSGRLVPENILGSKSAGTLVLARTAAGVAVGLTVASTPAGAAVRAAAAVSAVHARPLVDVDASTSTIEGTTRRYTEAVVTTILVKTAPADRREGWDPAEVDGADPAARAALDRRLLLL